MIKFAISLCRNTTRFATYKGFRNQEKMTVEEQEQMTEDLKGAYRDLAENLESEDSILNMFTGEKKQEKQQLTELDEVTAYINMVNSSFQKFYSNLSPEEQLKRSKDLIKAYSLNQDFEAVTQLNQDYQDYSLFNKNLLQVKYNSQKIEDPDFPKKNEINFLGDLDENMKERSQTERVYSYLYKNPKSMQYEYTEENKVQEKVDQGGLTLLTIDSNEKEKKGFDANEDHNMLEESSDSEPEGEWEIDTNDVERQQDDEALDDKELRLSFKAKFELFDLFNQGWSVRDLSLRYGILPNRVKAIVYQKRYFFDEIFPTMSLDFLKDLINLEFQYENTFGCVDYGVDIDDMAQAEKGYLQTNFSHANRNVDIKALGEKEQQRLKQFFDKKKLKKYDIVTEKFVGDGNKGYYLKSWIMNKTRSKHGVSKMFERVIKDSHKPHKLPHSVQERLHFGPRSAGAKFGHK